MYTTLLYHFEHNEQFAKIAISSVRAVAFELFGLNLLIGIYSPICEPDVPALYIDILRGLGNSKDSFTTIELQIGSDTKKY